mmetsp:Transcript_95169/g.266494  ORF Transcript_95169/g.266494 Transcript_95169/m.266494 type:complete len:214 (+) Transcript_95169:185-826(+)
MRRPMRSAERHRAPWDDGTSKRIISSAGRTFALDGDVHPKPPSTTAALSTGELSRPCEDRAAGCVGDAPRRPMLAVKHIPSCSPLNSKRIASSAARVLARDGDPHPKPSPPSAPALPDSAGKRSGTSVARVKRRMSPERRALGVRPFRGDNALYKLTEPTKYGEYGGGEAASHGAAGLCRAIFLCATGSRWNRASSTCVRRGVGDATCGARLE